MARYAKKRGFKRRGTPGRKRRSGFRPSKWTKRINSITRGGYRL